MTRKRSLNYKLNKFGFIVSLLLLVFVVVGCTEKPKEIAVLMYDLDDPFIEGVADYLLQYNDTGYHVTVYDCQNSQILQNETAERLYKEKIDLLVINPVDRLSSYIFVEKSKKEGIPLIFFNREPLREDLESYDDAYYVGANAIESGFMQAEMIANYFDDDPDKLGGFDKNDDQVIQSIILKGEQGHQDAEERSRAVIEALEARGFEVEVLLTQIANWNETVAYRAMGEIMDEYDNDIELLISNNDAMAIGATKYLQDHYYFGNVTNGVTTRIPFPIVGIDGLDEAVELIEQGYMYGTIINDGDSMAKAILQLTGYILESKSDSLEYELVDGNYIWISYKNHSKE